MHWALDYLRFSRAVGINPVFTGSFAMGGATAGALVQLASMAIRSGKAEFVACVFGDAAKTGKKRPLVAAGGALGTEAANNGAWGAYGATTWSGLTANRHMELYGTTTEQLGEVAVAARSHAALNPMAVMRNPITLEDHRESRMIVEPFRLLDCCLVSDGGACLIVTSVDRARDLPHKVVRVAGAGQGFTSQDHEMEQWWYGPHQKAAVDRAYAEAGIGPADVDVAELYDNFTISTIVWLEHAGFCKPGEGGPFVEGGRIALGGDLPVNTHGGHLSAGHPQGWWTIAEGVQQIRGAAGDRQVVDAEVCLTTGRGLVLNTASALVLTGEA
jgi:acetyl-CoA acetyltransferase